MKTNKPKVQKKVAKKAAKKDLEKTLTDKILEVVQQLAHDAERIGVDIRKVGKNVSKELVKRFSPVKAVVEGKIKPQEAKKEKPKKTGVVLQEKTANKKVKKDVAKAHKAVKAAATKAKSVSNSVKVVPIVSLEKVEEAISKPVADKKTTPAVKTPAVKSAPATSRTKKPLAKKATSKPGKEGDVN